MTAEQPAIELVDHPGGGHYDAIVDGTTAGSAFYRVLEGRLVVTHTEVHEAFEGRGVGAAIAKGLLASVRANGQQIVPVCPFFSGYIDRHPEYEDLVDRTTLDALRSR